MNGEEGDRSPLISVENLSKSFGKKKVLDNVNFKLYPHEIVGFAGPSGSGKSVFLKILLGFFKQDRGKISKHSNLEIGFSLQGNPLYDYLTVEQNLNYFAKINDISKGDRKTRIDHLIEELQLSSYRNVLAKNLSGGTKKRVDLACSLLNDPDVLILDEPFLGLDPRLVNQLSKFIQHINTRGVAVIISSHRIPQLSQICNRFVEIKDEKIIDGLSNLNEGAE